MCSYAGLADWQDPLNRPTLCEAFLRFKQGCSAHLFTPSTWLGVLGRFGVSQRGERARRTGPAGMR